MSGYVIIVERAEEGGFGAWSPELPGCVAVGDSEAETIQEMHEAIRGHLDVMREYGEPIPAPNAVAASVYAPSAA